MAWARFTADFDWPPLRAWHVAYKAGMRCNVPRACSRGRLAAGAAVAIEAPPTRAHRRAAEGDPYWTAEAAGVIDPSLPLQKAVYDALRAGLTRASASTTACRSTPPARSRPASRSWHIGEDHVVSDADQCHDASSAYVTVHVWSRAVGKVEAKTIMAQVCLLLDVLWPSPASR
jgi:hypothetical protein